MKVTTVPLLAGNAPSFFDAWKRLWVLYVLRKIDPLFFLADEGPKLAGYLPHFLFSKLAKCIVRRLISPSPLSP